MSDDLSALKALAAFLDEMDRVDDLNRGGAHYDDVVYGLNDFELRRSDLRALLARVEEAEGAIAEASEFATAQRDEIRGRYLSTGGSPARYLGFADACDDILLILDRSKGADG